MKLIKFENTMFPLIFNDEFFEDKINSINLELSKKYPKTNFFEVDKEFNFEIAIPGAKKENIEVCVKKDDFLRVTHAIPKGIEEEQKKEKDIKYNFKEFSCSSFERSFELPKNCDIDKIKSKYEDGILKITIPKIKFENLQKTIKIE